MATKANLVIDQGASFTTSITVADDDGVAIDLTGYTGQAQFRKHYTSSNSVSFTVSIAPVSGQVTLSLTANQSSNVASGRYVYDCELTNTSTGTISRVLEGIITVTPQVTR
jgi:hypothetical protein